MREALFYERAGEGRVRCGLCRFRCLIADGHAGICRVRVNQGGVLYTLVYGKAVAEHVDPIEKKPLFHLLPGSRSYSVATAGCNFRCLHCQNYSIAQPDLDPLAIPGYEVSPEEIVRRALDAGCASISYTYTEPTIYFEYALETAKLAAEAGLKNIFVTNGYITAEALAAIRPWLDVANIDLKGHSEKFYHEVVHAMAREVFDSILAYKRLGIWIEITTLVIPGHNDSDDDLGGIASFIAEKVGRETPWHVSAFYPTHKLTQVPPTPVRTIERARRIGLEAGLKYVYAGNVPGSGGENTCCPSCSAVVVRREGYRVKDNLIVGGRCPACSAAVDGIWT